MTELSPDLKNIWNEMDKLRNAFVDIKNANVALVKLTENQKQQLAKSRNRCKRLIETFTTKYRSIMDTSASLKSELNHLRQVINDLQQENDNQALELKTKDDLIIKLEDEMEIVRSQIDFQADQHNKDIEKNQERNRIETNREIAQYKSKLDASNAEIERLKERLEQQKDLLKERKNNNYKRFSHPALSDSEINNNKEKNSTKRKKIQDSKWPHLNIKTITLAPKAALPNTAEQLVKKKKLFSLDNENIVDLETTCE